MQLVTCMISFSLSISIGYMGEAAAKRSDLASLDLCIKFFNTYLRSAINTNDVRTVYNVLYQYRKLGESIIELGKDIAEERTNEENDLENRAVRIAKFLRYYSFVCLQQKLVFLVEVISQDIRVMCEVAFQVNR